MWRLEIGSGELDEGVEFDMASHPGGNVAVAAEAASGEVVLIMVGSDGLVSEIGEVHSGSLYTAFTESGYLYWVEESPDGNAVLFVWNPLNTAGQSIVEVTEDEGLQIVGTFGDSVVTVIKDDIGAVFELFTLEGEGTTLSEFDDEVVSSHIQGDYLYVVGAHTMSVVPLRLGTPVVSSEWDSIEALHSSEGTLVAVGHERSSRILLSIGIGHGEETEVEYGEYDDVVSAQVYDDLLLASVTDESDVETLVFDLLSGERRTYDFDYGGYRLRPSAGWAIIETIFVTGIQGPASFPGQIFADHYAAAETHIGGTYSGDITEPFEVDFYVFEVPEGLGILAASISTAGPTDVVMQLYEVVDVGNEELLVEDDDGGEGGNAKINMRLSAGWYLVAVTGFNDTTGTYELHIGQGE